MEKGLNSFIGFIGQGYVGKNYADNFEKRGYSVVRYALEKPYQDNRKELANCGIIFVAVPTPTTPDGFDDSIVRSALKGIEGEKIAVIKSTVLPGTTEKIQADFSNLTVLYSPEFLSETTAAKDITNPFANIIGLPQNTQKHKDAANLVIKILPKSKKETLCTSREAEMIKYAHNTLGYSKVVFINLLFEAAGKLGVDWEVVKEALSADPMVAPFHLEPVHKSGRGAGGRCHIKDFEAFLRLYQSTVSDSLGENVLTALRDKNLSLLEESGKDPDIISEVYGKQT